MSLEIALQENTAAVREQAAALRELIAALAQGISPTHGAMRPMIDTVTPAVPGFLKQSEKKAEAVDTYAEPAAAVVEAPAAQPAAQPAVEEAAPTPEAEIAGGKTGAQAEEALHGIANVEPQPTATYDDVKDAVLAMVKAKGRDAATAVLATFGVEKAPDLKPEQYDAVVVACKKAMA